jgi:ribosomal protein L11 methyltransferase
MHKYYSELVVKVSSHHSLFSDFLSDTLPVGFEETDDGFIVRSEEELDTIIWGLEQFNEALQKALVTTIELECTQTKLKNSDWIASYQKSIEPITIDRFFIHPTWSQENPDLINIAIDPALAFGTGHHPTTASCLRAIATYVKETDRVLDVGCGSGILGIAAMKLGADVDACDTDPISVENSIENAKLNHLVYSNIWEGSSSLRDKKYNIVVANIVADVLTFIAKDLKAALEEDSILILSGILNNYEDKVLAYYKDLKLLQRIPQEEWITLVLQKEEK